MLFFGNGTEEPFVAFPVSCVDTIVEYLFEFFWEMLDEVADEIKCRDGFHDQFVILVAVIVEGDHVTIIFINARGGNGAPAEIAADIFNYSPEDTLIRFSANIEIAFVVSVDGGFDFLKKELILSSSSLRSAVWKASRMKQ